MSEHVQNIIWSRHRHDLFIPHCLNTIEVLVTQSKDKRLESMILMCAVNESPGWDF
jgi:hypothetical protein